MVKKSAFGLIVYTWLVILWGAWVRISHSGDGCGATWPLCQGNYLPEEPVLATLIELAHRLSSGLFGVAVIALVVACRRTYPAGHPARHLSVYTLVFTISEALLGALLVLGGLVGDNATELRTGAMSLHMVNSLLLVGFATLTWRHCDPALPSEDFWQPIRRFLKGLDLRTGSALVLILLLCVLGTIAALSNTLFPSHSLLEGISEDFSQDSHFLLRLRVLHPLFGATLGLLLGTVFWKSQYGVWGRRLSLTLVCMVVIGSANLIFLAPTPLKILHILGAHYCWFLVINCALETQTKPRAT